MQKFNVGDLVCFGERRDDFPYTIIHIHQAPRDERCWFVCAYKGDIPYIKKAHELTLHTAAKQPVEEGLLRDLNLKPGDAIELVSFGKDGDNSSGVGYYEGKKWTVGPEGQTVLMEDGNWNPVWTCEWVYRVVSRAKVAKYGDWKLGQPSRDIKEEDIQVSRDPDGEIVSYRVKIEPKVGTVTVYGTDRVYGPHLIGAATHKITFTTIDGEPDCTSVKMEKL